MLKVATVCSGIGSPIIIYRAIFPNGKCYIGLTRGNLKRRKYEHLYRSKTKYNLPFYNAINKHGWDNLEWEILHSCEILTEAENKEIEFIKYFQNNYNVSAGGNAGLISDETRKKISEKLKGRIFTQEWKSKISKSVTKIYSNHENRKELSKKVKEAMWRDDVRKNYLEGIKNRDDTNMKNALKEHFDNSRKEKFKILNDNYTYNMTWQILHKKTGISLGFIRKYKAEWIG